MKHSKQVLQFILEASWSRFPPKVRHQSKRCLLDGLGVLLAGMQTPIGGLMNRIAAEQFCGDQGTILLSGKKASAAGAALANGFAANALDMDDGYRLVKGHPGACILAPLFAAAELKSGCSGKDFLSALIVGYETAICAGKIQHAVYPSYHASGSWGAVGGAAAAGKLLGLDTVTLSHAIGTAGYHAPIALMMKGIAQPSMGKDSIGWGGMVALMSVLMARDGFTGIRPIFEDAPDPEWIGNLGAQYEILNLYFKPYAACRWAQPAITGALNLCRSHKIETQQIARIHVHTFEAATRLSCNAPQTTEEAQYNLAFPIAAALIDGEVGPKQVLAPRIFDETIISLAQKVDTEGSDEFERLFPAKACAEVLIYTLDGKEFSSGRMEAPWEPPDTLPTDAELQAKFQQLVEPLLGKPKTAQLTDTIWCFETVSDLSTFINGCIR